MFSVTYKKYGLKIGSIWFCHEPGEATQQSKADFIFLHGIRKNTFNHAICKPLDTLTTDLTAPAEAIFKQFSKNCQNDINRAKKENLEVLVYKPDDLIKDPVILAEFEREHAAFTKLKGIHNAYNAAAVKEYVESGNMLLTKVCREAEVYAQHFYVCDGQNAELLYSISNFRTEGIDRNFVGRANRYLHWTDIQYLQQHNLHHLDWGGISSVTTPNGVDRFKKGFGGQQDKHYNVIIGQSLLGRLAVFAMNLKRRN